MSLKEHFGPLSSWSIKGSPKGTSLTELVWAYVQSSGILEDFPALGKELYFLYRSYSMVNLKFRWAAATVILLNISEKKLEQYEMWPEP